MAAISVEVKPQSAQEQFLASPADFVIYGGSAGGGKTWALLLEPLRHKDNPKFGAVIFRRTYAQIEQEGGLWQKSLELYPMLGAKSNSTQLLHKFGKGGRVRFAHLQYEKNLTDYQGGEITLLEFDELTHFTEREVFYLISRTRSMSGIRPYIRGTCNPDPDSWVARFIEWWIDKDGYIIPERSGVVRYFARVDDAIVWGDSKEELIELYPQLTDDDCMSFTFILARLQDNKALLEKDPAYLSKLRVLPKVERERLLGDWEKGGNWKIREAKGMYFKRQWFEVIERAPLNIPKVSAWDFAGTKPSKDSPDPDYTVRVKLGKDKEGILYVLDCVYDRQNPAEVEKLYVHTVKADGKNVINWIPQDPGEAGKTVALQRVNHKDLVGYAVRAERRTGDKVTNATSASSKAEQGLIKVVRASWNDFFFQQLETFPEGHDDVVDALADAVNHAPEASSFTVKGETR